MDIKQIKQQEQIVEGCVTFGNGLTKKISRKLRVKKNLKILSSREWNIKQLQLTQNGGKSIFSYIKQARCDYLFVGHIHSPSIIKNIFSVNFINLTRLKVINSAIYNIEILAFMNLPNLRYFGLIFCKVDNTKPLVKAFWPSIQRVVVREQNINLSSRKEFMGRIKANNELEILGLGWYDANFFSFSKFEAQKISTFVYYLLNNQYDDDPIIQKFNLTFKRKYSQTKVSGIGNRIRQ